MPRDFAAVARFELAKALRARFTWAALALPALVSGLSVALGGAARKAQSLVAGEAAAAAPAPSAYLAFAKGAGNGLALAGILLLLYASLSLANEGHWRTYKTIMIRPRGRLSWIAGKFAVLVLLAVGMAVAVAAASWFAGRLTGHYTSIEEDGYVYYEAAFLFRACLRAFALLLPPLIALAAFGLMFSAATDHTGIAASLCLGGYIILETAKGQMGDGRRLLFNTFMPSLVDSSYFQVLKGLSEGMSDAVWPDGLTAYNIAVPLVSALLFLSIASVIFTRRNFLN